MFQNGPRSQSAAEYARESAGRTITAASQYQAENWFDGSLDSVDRRLATCDKLLHKARSAVGMGGFGTGPGLARIASLETDRQGLTELRHTLLQAGNDRHTSNITELARSADNKMAALTPRDRRYVELEAAKILRANVDCRDFDEIAERTRRVAAVDTSTLSSRRSAAITEALVARTVQLARRTRPQRIKTASHPAAPVQDYPSELMYF